MLDRHSPPARPGDLEERNPWQLSLELRIERAMTVDHLSPPAVGCWLLHEEEDGLAGHGIAGVAGPRSLCQKREPLPLLETGQRPDDRRGCDLDPTDLTHRVHIGDRNGTR